MTGGEGHLVKFAHVPGADDQASGVGVLANLLNDLRDLVHCIPIGLTPRAPLDAVDPTEVPFFIGPFIPDRDLMVVEELQVGLSSEEPKELIDNGLEVSFLGGNQRKPFAQIKSQLMAEDAIRTYTCAIFSRFTVL